MYFKRWLKSANYAIEGILHAAKTQRHVRYHLFSAATVLLLSYILGITKTEFLIISLAVIAVLLAELINSAIETVVDIISPERNEKARIAKDISAGAVLITAFGAVIIGYIILFPYLKEVFYRGLYITKHSVEEVSLIAFIIVLILVVITKAYFGRGLPLKGGMPSGHAALSFSAWMVITFLTENFIASVISFIIAIVISHSRITSKAHTLWEVILGGLIGATVTFLLFKIFS
jgi:diacylglycerol kinase (ATP)